MKTSSAKSKGRRLCLKVQEELYSFAPDLEPGDIEVTSSGAGGEDIKLSPAARKKFPISIECKNSETTSPWTWYKQAQSNAKGHHPVVVFSRNHHEPMVLLSLESFLKLIC